MNSRLVVFKGKKDGINIFLNDIVPFEELRDFFRQKVRGAGTFFSNSTVRVNFSGRDLSDDEKGALLKIIREESVDIKEVIEVPKIVDKPDAPAQKVVSQGGGFSSGDNRTVYHKGSVRSGQCVSHDGSIVIVGDVNPGAKIIAKGNIIVLGFLKGFVHAGFEGDGECFIYALDFSPTQIRISDIITFIPSDRAKNEDKAKYAYIREGKIYISSVML
ncbi:putative septum site-determining protein MinC [Clostridia bacterium]|nr:putative septum site-determining protein MinC [Clostridia bacterium]